MRTKAPIVTVKIKSSGGVHSLYIDGRIGEKNKTFLIDPGATRTIARPKIVKEYSRMSPATVQLRTATGEKIKTYGEVNVPVSIGKTTAKHIILVAEVWLFLEAKCQKYCVVYMKVRQKDTLASQRLYKRFQSGSNG